VVSVPPATPLPATQAICGGSPPVSPVPADKAGGLFSALKDVIPVLAVYSFFAGWIYAYAFFKAFRVPVSSLDIPFQYFFMYSFSALASWKGAFLILAAIIFVFAFQKYKLPMLGVACALFPLLFGIAFVQGTSDATLQRHASTNDRIVLAFKEDAGKTIPPDLIVNNNASHLRLLTESKDRVYVFYQSPSIAPDDFPAAVVYDVAKSDLVTEVRQVTDKRNLTLPETLWRIIHEQPAK
jgi:hypothetical protein